MIHQKNKAKDVLYLFKYQIKTKIIRDKEAHLLFITWTAYIYLRQGHNLEIPVIEQKRSLKRYLVQEIFRSLHYPYPENIFLFTLSISTHAYNLLQHLMVVVCEILTLLKHLGECWEEDYRKGKKLILLSPWL